MDDFMHPGHPLSPLNQSNPGSALNPSNEGALPYSNAPFDYEAAGYAALILLGALFVIGIMLWFIARSDRKDYEQRRSRRMVRKD
ncbi:MAG: hypothetical protein HYT12_04590 [Candidatus Liptonbacteria bacterium]|nr:hypothetical protein [Candidatus Liptonbacteria bacterium]